MPSEGKIFPEHRLPSTPPSGIDECEVGLLLPPCDNISLTTEESHSQVRIGGSDRRTDPLRKNRDVLFSV